MVSRNTAAPADDPGGDPDFTALSESEQRVVAERLQRIVESGWKPFWCKDPLCTTGDPHAKVGPLGEVIFVDETALTGPKGEPVAGYYRSPYPGKGLVEHVILDPTKVRDDDEYIGRVVLDPNWAHNHARADQRLPPWKRKWTLFIMSGRGTGKTRTGVEFVTLCARKGQDGAILGRRGTELVNTHVAEILKHAHPEFMPIHYASKDTLVWPNGATTYLFSAEKPENIRSVNLSYVWVDEAAFMEFIRTAWMNLKMATRIDDPDSPIHFLITSTPTSTEWVIEMEDDPDVEIRRVSTYANRANLAPSFIRDMEKDFEGTRMGRQEIHGEVLRDVVGALWNEDMFRHFKIDTPNQFATFLETMDDIVVAIDPAGTANKRSDKTGIIAVGVQHTDIDGEYLDASRFYVLADGTLKGSPTEWARAAYSVARIVKARRIIAEKNFGGDMVKQVLSDFAKTHRPEALNDDGESMADLVSVVHGTESKETRAESTVGKYEQGRVEHVVNPTVYGDFSSLEKEQTLWVPRSRGGKSPSPNRIDALVWAVKALEASLRFAAQSASNSVLDKMHSRPAAAPLSHSQGPGGREVTPLIPEARAKYAPLIPQAGEPKNFENPVKKSWPGKRPPGVKKIA